MINNVCALQTDVRHDGHCPAFRGDGKTAWFHRIMGFQKRMDGHVAQRDRLHRFLFQDDDIHPRSEWIIKSAVSLIKMVARLTEIGLGSFEIMHIRNKEKQEVDFVLVKNGKPVALFEARESDGDISKARLCLGKHLSVPYFPIVRRCQKAEAFSGNCGVIPAEADIHFLFFPLSFERSTWNIARRTSVLLFSRSTIHYSSRAFNSCNFFCLLYYSPRIIKQLSNINWG
jgi:hypothetical protein